jgi:hypothetical protein
MEGKSKLELLREKNVQNIEGNIQKRMTYLILEKFRDYKRQEILTAQRINNSMKKKAEAHKKALQQKAENSSRNIALNKQREINIRARELARDQEELQRRKDFKAPRISIDDKILRY